MFQCFNECTGPCNNNSWHPGAFRNGLKIIDDSYQSLSTEEKERVLRDLYGVEKPMEETTEFVNAKLEELDRELETLNDSIKKAYIQAKTFEDRGTEEYASSRKFRLMFLRAERFDVPKAALRLVRYLKDKLDMFGEEVLPRRIKAEDLTQQDMETLTSGFICMTNETDASGRLLCFLRRSIYFGQNVTCMIRCVFYLVQIALEDNEEAQRKGLVVISFNVGSQLLQWKSQFRKYMPMYRLTSRGLPIRIAASHLFYNDIKETFLLNISAVVLPNDLRSRLHRHYVTTHEECLFVLMSLGIHPNALPYTEEGVFRKEVLCRYLAEIPSFSHKLLE